MRAAVVKKTVMLNVAKVLESEAQREEVMTDCVLLLEEVRSRTSNREN